MVPEWWPTLPQPSSRSRVNRKFAERTMRKEQPQILPLRFAQRQDDSAAGWRGVGRIRITGEWSPTRNCFG